MLLPAVRDSIFSCAHCGQASLGRGGYGTGALCVLVDIIADVLRQDSDDEDAEAKNENCEKALLKSREVFLSRQTETLPATLIRGKCTVTLLSEVETFTSYTNRDDAFFYALVFDPHQKTLLADRGNIRIGSEYQAALPALVKEGRDETLEELQWQPNNGLEEDKIDQFVIISRSVGTFARALDCSSSVKQPSLHMSAAAASRDITVLHAYQVHHQLLVFFLTQFTCQALHGHQYDISQALASLVPATGPVLCRDEMEDWSSAEANLFEEAIEKYGKDFNGIKKDFLPWKSMRNIIEYFFMWKTTDVSLLAVQHLLNRDIFFHAPSLVLISAVRAAEKSESSGK